MIEIIILKIYRNSTLNPNSDLNPVNAFRSLDPFHPVIIDDDSDDELIPTIDTCASARIGSGIR